MLETEKKIHLKHTIVLITTMRDFKSMFSIPSIFPSVSSEIGSGSDVLFI